MNKARKMAHRRHCKGFAEETGGLPGPDAGKQTDAQWTDHGQNEGSPRTATGHAEQLPIWMGQVADILRTKDREVGEFSATAIAQICGVDDSTIRTRWLKSINSELADESILKVEGKYTELAMELFAHMAECRDVGLNPAEWVLQVLKPALSSIPRQQQVDPDIYQTALARREEDNASQSKALQIKWAEVKQRRQQEAMACQQLSAVDLERIRLEEKAKILAEVEERDRIRRELLAELGML